MTVNPNYLIWLDMEMSGLDPGTDRILEVALVVTDADLITIAESPVWVVRQTDAILEGMDKWNQSTHSKSGLIEKVKLSQWQEPQVEKKILSFLKKYVPERTSPMCGNSICQDRRFMARWMPQLEAYFHYRNLDVSTIKELVKRWHPEIGKGLVKSAKHEALADVYDSIAELKYYREHFFKLPL